MAFHEGRAFHASLPGGQQGGRVHVSPAGVVWEGESAQVLLPMHGLHLEAGGASDRIVFFRHPGVEGWVVTTTSLDILKDSALAGNPGVAALIGKAHRKRAMSTPMIGHRSSAIRTLIGEIRPGLQRLFGAKEVFFMTSSATTVMESGLRNLVSPRALVASCGEFGKRWHEIAKSCGIGSDLLEAPIGSPVDVGAIVEALRPGRHDALCLTWSETSTGVLNPIAEIVRAVKPLGEIAILIDAVTAVAALEIDFDALGADLLLAGTQKAMTMPPGLAVYALSERALAKAATIPSRGWATDFLRNKSSMDKNETQATPSVSLLFALTAQLARIHEEGMPARAARHARMSSMSCAWGDAHGHEVLAAKGFRSQTVTCLQSPKVPTPQLIEGVTKRCGAVLGAGYGDLKATHFRIGHMGEHSPETLQVVLDAVSEVVG